jgi:hypothetical protein
MSTTPAEIKPGARSTRVDPAGPPAVDVLAIGLGLAMASAGRLGLETALRAGTISQEGRRRILAAIVLPGETRLRTLTNALSTGAESLTGWFESFSFEVARLDAATTIALMGPARIGPSDQEEFKKEYTIQYNYAKGFRDDLKSGTTTLGGMALARSALYAHAAWGVAFGMQRASQGRLGLIMMEKRVLGVADHCDDCRREADRGWAVLGTLPAIGESRCRARCHCWFEYR